MHPNQITDPNRKSLNAVLLECLKFKIERNFHLKLHKNHAYDVGTWLKIIGRELRLKIIIIAIIAECRGMREIAWSKTQK